MLHTIGWPTDRARCAQIEKVHPFLGGATSTPTYIGVLALGFEEPLLREISNHLIEYA